MQLTFILIGYFPSCQVLSDCPSQHVLGYEQRTYEQRQAMLGKRQNWIPYPFLQTIVRLSLLRTRHVGVHCDPSAREDGDEAAPNDVPDGAAMCEVGARIRFQ